MSPFRVCLIVCALVLLARPSHAVDFRLAKITTASTDLKAGLVTVQFELSEGKTVKVVRAGPAFRPATKIVVVQPKSPEEVKAIEAARKLEEARRAAEPKEPPGAIESKEGRGSKGRELSELAEPSIEGPTETATAITKPEMDSVLPPLEARLKQTLPDDAQKLPVGSVPENLKADWWTYKSLHLLHQSLQSHQPIAPASLEKPATSPPAK